MNKDKIFFFIQALLKYNSFALGIWLRYWLYKPFFKQFGKNIKIKDGVTFKYPSDISIGDGSVMGEYCYFVGKGGLDIGNNVIIGAGSKVITSSHNYDSLEQSIYSQGMSYESVSIGDDVWFGFDVKVLCGSIIKDGTIVGANSLVNGKYDQKNIVLAGTPAKILKTRDI